MAKVFIPDPVLLKQSGFGRWAHVPVLFDDHGGYLPEHSRYLRERAARIFRPGSDFKDFPRHATLKAIAYHLADFSRWTALTLHDWRTVTYDAVIAYQNDLLHGRCSASGRPLNPKTANALADDVTHFLHWASINGFPHLLSSRYIMPTRASRHNGWHMPYPIVGDLRYHMADKLSIAHIQTLWFDLFARKMEDEIMVTRVLLCPIELLDRARRESYFPTFIDLSCRNNLRFSTSID
ncbi:hypothetical protein [Tardiphaga sp. P9-11]|uniref:hypothetical protein n=1 Tax=Tardiphaga sp. P9-11 TaxID=2024614 RepID=UPI0011F3057B|nr:hypothetical protein [Tardiphaga sp. P9-11]KAA0074726.1 hypothetical protein CIW50_17715 [Tardiphaga sp. P9-11]